MFGKTGSVISKTISDIKNVVFISRLIFYGLGIVIPIYNISFSVGFLPLHIASLCISVAMLILFLVYRDTDDKKQRKTIKAKRKNLKKVKRWVNRLSNLYVVLCTVYAVCVINTDMSPLSLLLAVFAIISLIISILFELIRMIAEKRLCVIEAALKNDINASPIMGIINIIRKVKGIHSERSSGRKAKDDIIVDDYTDESFTSRK